MPSPKRISSISRPYIRVCECRWVCVCMCVCDQLQVSLAPIRRHFMALLICEVSEMSLTLAFCTQLATLLSAHRARPPTQLICLIEFLNIAVVVATLCLPDCLTACHAVQGNLDDCFLFRSSAMLACSTPHYCLILLLLLPLPLRLPLMPGCQLASVCPSLSKTVSLSMSVVATRITSITIFTMPFLITVSIVRLQRGIFIYTLLAAFLFDQ